MHLHFAKIGRDVLISHDLPISHAFPWQKSKWILYGMFRRVIRSTTDETVVWYDRNLEGWEFHLFGLGRKGQTDSEKNARKIIENDLLLYNVRIINDPRLINLL